MHACVLAAAPRCVRSAALRRLHSQRCGPTPAHPLPLCTQVPPRNCRYGRDIGIPVRPCCMAACKGHRPWARDRALVAFAAFLARELTGFCTPGRLCAQTLARPALPQVLMNFVMVCSMSVTSPLILPFGLLYFVGLWAVWRYQALYVYQRQYESGGQVGGRQGRWCRRRT